MKNDFYLELLLEDLELEDLLNFLEILIFVYLFLYYLHSFLLFKSEFVSFYLPVSFFSAIPTFII